MKYCEIYPEHVVTVPAAAKVRHVRLRQKERDRVIQYTYERETVAVRYLFAVLRRPTNRKIAALASHGTAAGAQHLRTVSALM